MTGDLAEKGAELILVIYLIGCSRADSYVRFRKNRLSADLIDKLQRGVYCRHTVLARGRDARSLVNRLHCCLALPESQLAGLDSSCDVEILPQLCVKLKPVLVVGLDPVDAAMSESEVGDRAVDLAVILHGVHFVILSKRSFQVIVQRIVRSVSDAQNIHAVLVQPAAEVPGKLGDIKTRFIPVSFLFSIPEITDLINQGLLIILYYDTKNTQV